MQVLDVSFPSLTSCCLPACQEAGDPLTDGGGYRELCEFILKGVRDDGVESRAEVHKQDPCISPWFVQMLEDVVQSHIDCIIHRPVRSVSKLQGVQQGSSNVLQVAQHQSLE